jgi:GNAT superfamily N-acetyltransferase
MHPLFAHRAELDDVVVHRDYQRQGIARRLVEEARDYARSMGIEMLETSCRGGTPAEQVYPRLGFIEYGRLLRGIKEPWGDHHVFDMVYFYQPLESTERQ